MVITAYNWEVILVCDHVATRTTINDDRYVYFLHKKLHPEICKVWPMLLLVGVIILHDNLQPHRKDCHKNWRKCMEQICLKNIWVFTSRHNCHIYLNIYHIDTQASQVPSSTTMLSDGLPLHALSWKQVLPSWNCFIHILTVDSHLSFPNFRK